MGLSKPIVIANSNIDISNLATKEDVSKSGSVKSFQKGYMLGTVTSTKTENVKYYDGATYSVYIDITISSVDTDKCSIYLKGTEAYKYNARVLGSILRVYFEGVSVATPNAMTCYAFGWEVVEYD